MRVAIIMGSTSDLPKVEPAIGILKEYGVTVDVRCLSAHRAHAGFRSLLKKQIITEHRLSLLPQVWQQHFRVS